MITYTHTRLLDLIQGSAPAQLPSAVARLLCDGGDPDESSPISALHLAAILNRPQVIAPLRKAGAKLHRKDQNGWSPSMKAASLGNLDFLAEMNRFKVSFALDRLPNNSTLLHVAIYFRQQSLVDFFLKNGVNPDVINDRGKTAEQERNFLAKALLPIGHPLPIGGDQQSFALSRVTDLAVNLSSLSPAAPVLNDSSHCKEVLHAALAKQFIARGEIRKMTAMA